MAAPFHAFAIPDSWRSTRARSLIAGGACSGLFIGTVCGWSAIVNVLLPDGCFAEAESPSQMLLIIYSASICAMSLSGTPAGLLCDRAPLFIGVAVSGACVVLGSFLVGVLPSSAGFGFLPPFMLLAVGGNTCFFAATKLAFLFLPEQRPAILASICALYDASSAVPLLFYMAFQAGFSRATIFTTYAALGGLLFTSWACALVGVGVVDSGSGPSAVAVEGSGWGDGGSAAKRNSSEGAEFDDRAARMHRSASFTSQALAVASVVPSFRRSASSPSMRDGDPLDAQWHAMTIACCGSQLRGGLLDSLGAEGRGCVVDGTATHTSTQPHGRETAMEADSATSGSVPELHDAPLFRQLCSSQLAVGLTWYLLSQQRVNLYLGTARTLLASQGDANGYYAALHTALLPAGLAFVPAVAHVHRRFGVLGAMQLTTLIGAAHGTAACWLPLERQWVTFSLFTCLRMATFATFSIFMAEAFGPSTSGTLTGLLFLLGGLASLSLVPIG